MLNEKDEKLLELYKKDIRKKRILVFSLILIFIGGISLYYFYINFEQSSKEEINNEVKESIIDVENTNEQNLKDVTNEEKNIVTDDNKNSIESENTEESKEQVQEEATKVTDEENKKDTIENDNKEKETTEKSQVSTSEKPENKDFLFTDGYTMENVTQAAQKYLNSYNWSGECIPIRDDEGVYLGMRVIFY